MIENNPNWTTATSSRLMTKFGSINSTDFAAIFDNPKNLLEAPLADEFYYIRNIVVQTIGSNAFTGGGAVSFNYTGGEAAADSIPAINFQVSPPFITTLTGSNLAADGGFYLGKGIEITNATAAFAGGSDTIINWTINYYLIKAGVPQ